MMAKNFFVKRGFIFNVIRLVFEDEGDNNLTKITDSVSTL